MSSTAPGNDSAPQRSRSGVISAAGEALHIEDDGTDTPVTALQVETWTAEERAAARFVCPGCDVEVHPWNIDSQLRTPTFTARSGHAPDCRRSSDDADHRRNRGDTLAPVDGSRIPNRMLLPAPPTRRDPAARTDPAPLGRERPAPGRTPATEPRTGDGANPVPARSLGRVVFSWLELATHDERKKHSLTLPEIDDSSYAHAFKRLAFRDGAIPASARRVFYSNLRFTAAPIEDGEQLTLTLQPRQTYRRGQTPLLASLRIDRTGWPAGRRAALERDLRWAYDRASEHWADNTSPQVWLFFLADQSPKDPTVFDVADPRLLYFTDAQITYS